MILGFSKSVYKEGKEISDLEEEDRKDIKRKYKKIQITLAKRVLPSQRNREFQKHQIVFLLQNIIRKLQKP